MTFPVPGQDDVSPSTRSFRIFLKPIFLGFCPIFAQELIRKGIPHHFRAIVWQLLCSATDMPVKNQYSELLKMSSPCEKLIRRDIARTYPEHEFFKGQDSLGQEVLFNVMKVMSFLERQWILAIAQTLLWVLRLF